MKKILVLMVVIYAIMALQLNAAGKVGVISSIQEKSIVVNGNKIYCNNQTLF